MRTIEFIDGNTGFTIAERNFEEVPRPNREVYLKDGVRVDEPVEGAETVPIATVVKMAYGEDGEPAPDDQAVKIVILEYDQEGNLLRTNTMYKGS